MTFVGALQIGLAVTFVVGIAGFIRGLLIVNRRVCREDVDYPPE